MPVDINPAAIAASPQQRPFFKWMTVCCMVTFGCYLAVFMRLPVVPLYARGLGISVAQIGLINAAFFLMAGLLSLPLGLAADRRGSKPVAAAGVALMALMAFLLLFSQSFISLTGVYLAFGAGIAAFGPTMMALVSRIAPSTHLGRAYGWYTTALFGAMSLGPALGGHMAGLLGFKAVFTTIGLLLLVALGGLLLFLPGHRRATSASSALAIRDELRTLMGNRSVMGCWLVTLGACLGLGMFMSFIPLHARARGLDAGQIGMVFFTQGLANGLSRIPFGFLSDKVGRRSTLVVMGLTGFAFSLLWLGAAAGMSHFILGALLSGLSLGLAFTSVGALIAEAVAADSRAVAMGGYNTCIYWGMMISSLAMGAVIESLGFALSFYLIAFVNLGFCGLFVVMLKREKI